MAIATLGGNSAQSARGQPVPASAGAPIARLDDGAPVLVGDRRSSTADRSGRLYLGVNDDHLADNRGQFEVTLTVRGRGGARRF